MSLLPGWLADAKKTIPQWIQQISHSDGPGRYRFALEAYEPYDLDSSCMIENTRLVMEGLSAEIERQGWIDYLKGLQQPETGWLIDERMEQHILTEKEQPSDEEIFNVRRWTSRNGLITLLELGGIPEYRLKHQECFHNPEEVETYLEGLHWNSPWGAGSWAGAVIWFHQVNKLLGDTDADAIIQASCDWLLRKQNPVTGAWSDGSDVPLYNLVNGIFKIWIQAIPAVNFPVQYPEQVIDLCIRAMRESSELLNIPDPCSIFDVALVLDTAFHFCDHRRDEVAELTYEALLRIEPLLRSDGAFSYHEDRSLYSHGGLHLAPVRAQSDVTGTAITVNAISLLCNLCGLREALGWIPTTESRMKLSCSKGI